jgi:hypothetical protein
MSQEDLEKRTIDTLESSIDGIKKMILDLRYRSVYGPIAPALQHLEEAGFWLNKCLENHKEFLKEVNHDLWEKLNAVE